MAADNDLDAYSGGDLNEMKSVGSTDDVNIIVIYDGLSQNDSRVYYVNHGSLSTISNPGELNMGDPNTLKNTVTTIYNTYPAEKYALVFWNHGTGWHKDRPEGPTKYVCSDWGSGDDALTNSELDNALSYIRSNTGTSKIDMLGFDACLMQMIEIAYYIKDHALVMVGSEETESAEGWDYGALSSLIATPSMGPGLLGGYIVQDFVAIPDATLSALDMTKVVALANAVDTMADALNAVGGVGNSNVVSALYDTLYFDDYDYIDLYDFADELIDENINGAINSAAQGVKTAVDTTVLYYGYGYSSYSNSHGISIYFPDPYYSSYDSSYSSLDFASATSWDDVIH